jgi:acetyl esterase/lipase
VSEPSGPRDAPFDPELRAMARWLPRLVMSDRLAVRMRWLSQWLPAPRSTREVIVEPRTLGGVRALVYRPRATRGPCPAVLWLHGGGYVIGAPEQEGARCLALSRALGLVVVAPAYRLAPEHPFPAARDDAHAVLAAMRGDASLGVRADRIAVAGVSAGGGLAASLALHVRSEAPPLAAQILLYPMLDDRTTARPGLEDAAHRLWNQASNVHGWRSYLGREPGGASAPEGAVPSRAESVEGLPPTWIGVGTVDLFHEECTAFAARLRGSGVPCTLEIAHGGYHAFDVVSPRAAISRRFEASWRAALRNALGVG